MYSSRGIGRKAYEDRNGRERKSHSRGSQSPPIYRSERVRDERHDSRERTPPLRDRDRTERKRSIRSRSRSRERHSDRSHSLYVKSRSRRHSRSPESYMNKTSETICRSPKPLTSPSSRFPNSRSRSPSLKFDERRLESRTQKQNEFAKSNSGENSPIGSQMGFKSNSEALPKSHSSKSDNFDDRESTTSPLRTNQSSVGIDFNINTNASFMPKAKEPSVVSPDDYSDKLSVHSKNERSAKIESPVDRYTEPKTWTPMSRDFNHPSPHPYSDQRHNIDHISRDSREARREWDDDRNSPYYTTNMRKVEKRSPSPQRSVTRTPNVYDIKDTKKPLDIYGSRLAVVQEIYGERIRPPSPDIPRPRSPSYSREREMRNRSPEYARPNPITDSYVRSRSPEMSKFKREMDLSAAAYGIEKSRQLNSYLPAEQSPTYPIRNEPMLPKSTPFYGTSKMEISSPSQPSFALQSKPFDLQPKPFDSYNKRQPDTNSIEIPQQFQKQQEEKELQEKIAAVFANVNSIEDLINLKEAYRIKNISLDQLLQKSILREGEILRNKRRDRTGYKDPAIIENRNLQNDVRKKIDEVNKFLVEIDKKIRAYNKALKSTKEDNKVETEKLTNYEAQLLQNSLISTTGEEDDEEEEIEDEYESTNTKFEYYDPGSHWCRDCDKLIPKINDYFDHLHTKDHWKFVINESQPWKKSKKAIENKISFQTKSKTPIKGAQFLVPIRGFYCPLCSQYLADSNTAEEHLKSAKHNRVYLRFTCLNIDYEHKWNSDKGKALSRHQISEKKRLKEEEQKENEKKRLKEEQKIKEEKEAKKRKAEEENRRKDKDRDTSREKSEKDYKINKSENKANNNENSSERFRLKGVTMDLNSEKREKERDKFSSNKLFGKDRHNRNEKEKSKKRKRHLSSSSSSSSSSSPIEPLKKRTYFGDPYEDPKLKLKSFVPLIHLNKKTAKKYNCKELIKVIENALKKTESESIKMDFNCENDEVFETVKSDINDILNNLEDGKNDKVLDNNDNKEKISSTDESLPVVQKTNDSTIFSDSSDNALVIDTSMTETNTNNNNNTDNNDTNLEMNEKKTIPENGSDDENESTPKSKTILPNTEVDDVIENSKCGTNESVVKNDVLLASTANNIEPNELIINDSTICLINEETKNLNKVQ